MTTANVMVMMTAKVMMMTVEVMTVKHIISEFDDDYD